MAKQIAVRVAEIKHHTNTADIPLKRQQLRLFAELTLGSIDDLLKNIDMKDAPKNTAERDAIKKMRLIQKDIHTLLISIDADI
ncbi:hypothetical protein HJV52_001885 [Escherichia coli]|nr:hypothetical protein [Escherichia coli]HBA8036780.1 hypothetical protein [Escherichia coli]HBA8335780.1 hypothetical protein [Escherichia coli]